MIKNLILLLLFISSYSQGQSIQNYWSKSKDPAVFFETDIGQGYLFGPESTRKYFTSKRDKELKYFNYWLLDVCAVDNILLTMSDYVSSKIEKADLQDEEKVIWQIFPYINKRGDMIIAATYSILTESEYVDAKVRISQSYRMVFDGKNDYMNMYYNYSKNKFLK